MVFPKKDDKSSANQDLVERYQNGDQNLVIELVDGKYTIVDKSPKTEEKKVEQGNSSKDNVAKDNATQDNAAQNNTTKANATVSPGHSRTKVRDVETYSPFESNKLDANYTCPDCGKYYKNSALRYQHIKKAHEKIHADACPECEDKFPIIDYHLRNEHLMCPLCLANFNSGEDVDEHMLIVHRRQIDP